MAQFRKLRTWAAGLLALVWCSAGWAQSALVGIDFGPAGGVPQNWNLVSGVGSFSGLIDEAGNPVPVSLGVSGTGVDSFPVTPLPNTIPAHGNDLTNIGGSVYTFEDRVDLVLSGLQPETTYQLWVFAVRDIEGRAGLGFEQHVSVNGTLRVTQTARDRELTVNSRLGSSTETLGSSAILAQSDTAGVISIRVEDPGNLNILGGGVYLAGLAFQEWDGTREAQPVPAMPGFVLLLLVCLLGWTGYRHVLRG